MTALYELLPIYCKIDCRVLTSILHHTVPEVISQNVDAATVHGVHLGQLQLEGTCSAVIKILDVPWRPEEAYLLACRNRCLGS
jgi:hypothetical protein